MNDINKKSDKSPSRVKNVLNNCKNQALDMAMDGSKRIIDQLPIDLVVQLLAEIGDVNESTYRRGYQQGDFNATNQSSKAICDWRYMEVTPFTIAEPPPNAPSAYRSTVVERLSMETNEDRWPLLTELIARYDRIKNDE